MLLPVGISDHLLDRINCLYTDSFMQVDIKIILLLRSHLFKLFPLHLTAYVMRQHDPVVKWVNLPGEHCNLILLIELPIPAYKLKCCCSSSYYNDLFFGLYKLPDTYRCIFKIEEHTS